MAASQSKSSCEVSLNWHEPQGAQDTNTPGGDQSAHGRLSTTLCPKSFFSTNFSFSFTLLFLVLVLLFETVFHFIFVCTLP
jgi:hypothetical protein